MSITFKFNKPVKAIANEAVGGDRTLLFMANTAKRLMNPYVPMDTGSLADNVQTYVEDGVGVVHYTQPYAEKQYNGTDFNFNRDKEKHPLATAKWDKAAMAVQGDVLVNDTQNFINNR